MDIVTYALIKRELSTASKIGDMPIPDAGGYFTIDKIGAAFQEVGSQLAQTVPNKTNNSVAFLGDSLIMSQALLPYLPTYPDKWIQKTGFSYVANILLKQRFDHKGLFGHSGYTSRQVYEGTYVDDVIAVNPYYCVVLLGTNDQYGVDDIAVVKQALSNIWNKLLAKGIRVIATTIPPQTYSVSAAIKQKRALINNFIKDSVFNTPNMYLFDLARVMSDVTGDAFVSGYSSDNLHPNDLGGHHAGWELYNVLNPLIQPKNRLICTENDPSNLVAVNSLCLLDTNADGKADSWVIVLGTEGVPTIVPRTDGEPGKWQQISQTAGNTYVVRATSVGYNVGDMITGMIEFEIDPASTTATLQLECIFNGVANASATQEYKSVYNFNHSGVLKTPQTVIPIGCTSISLQATAIGAITVRFARPKLEIVGL